MLKIEMMPASYGDCLLVHYGTEAEPHRVLIDGGLEGNWKKLKDRLAEFGAPCALDLLVITHIDADHIGGVVKLLESAPETIAPADVWFNGKAQLDEVNDRFGAAQGERLSARLAELGWTQNGAFNGKAVMVPDKGDLPSVALNGGANLTLLSPGREQLSRLLTTWEDELARAGIQAGDAHLGPGTPTDNEDEAPSDEDRLGDAVAELADSLFKEDAAEANGSSIAFLFEWDGRRVIFGADAHPSVLREGIERLGGERAQIDAYKVAHHGSGRNTDADLLGVMECPAYLISTNGKRFGHPSDAAIARILVHGRPDKKRLFFNYKSDRNKSWASATLQKKYDYEALYPDADEEGITIEF